MEYNKSESKTQVIEYLQSNFLGCGFQELNELVVEKQNCVLCGTCAALCPRIEMNEKKPDLLDYDPECSTCYRFCPRVYFPEELFQAELFKDNEHDDYSIGSYREVVAAKSIDDDVLAVTQNGGVVSSLLIHALETKLIDGVILTDRDENWNPIPTIARTAKEILSCVGSKYTISPTLKIYAKATNKLKLRKLAFVGMPCQLHAVRKLQLYSPLSEEFGRFTLLIGLYCYSNYSYDLMNVFVKQDLGVSLKNVKKFDVANGKFFTYLKDGSKLETPIKKTKKFIWESCKYCRDYTAELADISIGSVGALKNDWNSVILRTNVGTELFNDAIKSKKLISGSELDLEKIEKEAFRKKTRVTLIDEKILSELHFLNLSELEIRTYSSLMSLGNASESVLSKALNHEVFVINEILDKLEKRGWITSHNGTFSSVNPSLVLTREIHELRRDLSKKIEILKHDVLPSLETLFVRNNISQIRDDES